MTASPAKFDSRPVWCLIAGTLLLVVLFASPWKTLAELAIGDERYTHTLVVPLLSLVFFYRQRDQWLAAPRPAPLGALPFAAGALLLFLISGPLEAITGPPLVSGRIAACVLLFWSLFWACFGPAAFRAALFPVLLLTLAIPLPETLIAAMETFLQQASAEATHLVFRLAQIPFHREGLQFALPGVTIEVARECSGIRSSNALLLTSLTLGQFLLSSKRRKFLLFAATLPLTIIKNAIRIASLSWLGVYVSKDFLLGDLHHQGGALFAALGLLLLVPVLLALMRAERSVGARSASG